jgi:hypothetical protein
MKAKSCLFLILALAVMLVFALNAVALADPSGGANNNPVGIVQGTYDPGDWEGMSKGELQKSTVLDIRDNPLKYDYTNFGLFLGWWKMYGEPPGGGFKQ